MKKTCLVLIFLLSFVTSVRAQGNLGPLAYSNCFQETPGASGLICMTVGLASGWFNFQGDVQNLHNSVLCSPTNSSKCGYTSVTALHFGGQYPTGTQYPLGGPLSPGNYLCVENDGTIGPCSAFSPMPYTGAVSITGNSGNGSDQISNVCVNGVCPVTAFGALSSTATKTATTVANNSSVSLNAIGDFAKGQYVAIYGAGATTTPATPTGLTVTPVTITTAAPSGAQNFTTFLAGCSTQDALAWCTASNDYCTLSNTGDYEVGDSITIAGAGPASANLTVTITKIPDTRGADGQGVEFSASTVGTTVTGAAVTGANCTTTRGYRAVAIGYDGSWSAPTTTVSSAVTGNALNWGNWDMVTAVGDANTQAILFECNKGGGSFSICDVERTDQWHYAGPSSSAPYNSYLLGGTTKTAPTFAEFDDVGVQHQYGRDYIQGTTPPAGAVNAIDLAQITAVSGNAITVSPAPQQSGTFTIGHDNGPAINSAINAACGNTSLTGGFCGTVTIPAGQFPIATTVSALRGVGLHILGSGGQPTAEPNTVSNSNLLWRGPIGGMAVSLNQEDHPKLENLAIQAWSGSTMGVGIDFDGYDPDGHGQTETCTHLILNSVFVGQSSVGVRMANQNGGNCEFNHISDSLVNVTYNHSGTGLYIGSGNNLGTRVENSYLSGKIGVWNIEGGIDLEDTPTGDLLAVGVWNNQYSNPITVNTVRNEHLARGIYSPTKGGLFGAQTLVENSTYVGIMPPTTDCQFMRTNGNQGVTYENNEWTFVPSAFSDYTTQICTNGWIGGIASLLSLNNWYDTNTTPFATSGSGAAFNYTSIRDFNSTGGTFTILPEQLESAGAGVIVGSGTTAEGSKTLNVSQPIYAGGNAITGSNKLLATALNNGAWASPGAIGGTAPNTLKGTSIFSTIGVGTVPAALSSFGTCDSSHEGLSGTQTNSTAACSAGATATSSGTTHCQIYCNGTNWLQTGL